MRAHPPERCRLPLARWPAADRAAWAAALRPADPLDDDDDGRGRAAHWRPATVRRVEASYGQWLGFLAAHGRLGAAAPAARITPAALRVYVTALSPACRGTTVLMRVDGLLEAARVLAPGADWAWLRRAVARLRRRARRDRRPKLPRLRPSGELVALGLELMAEAEAQAARRPLRAAARYRDGLIITLLAARPLRLASFAGLRLGVSLVRAGEGWWLRLGPEATKAAAPYEVPVPSALVPALERYLAVYRPRLLGGRADDHLWISKDGVPLRPQPVHTRITRLTRARLGVAICPHLFRDAAATTWALADPAHARAAAPLLGHRTLATTERHYNQARSLEAARRYHAALRRLRRRTATAVRQPR